MSPLSLLDPVVAPLSALLQLLAPVLPGPPGVQVLLALVALTWLVRAAMLPLAVSAVRAQRARAALAPELERVRRRYADDPRRLLQETAEVHRRAGVRPTAGLGVALLQAPVLAAMYRLVTVGGPADVVAGAVVLGAPLSAHWLPVVAAGGPAALVVAAAVAAVLLLLARLQSRALPDGPPLLRLLPYGTLAVAAVAPLAVTAYLLSSTAWTVAERAALTRLL